MEHIFGDPIGELEKITNLKEPYSQPQEETEFMRDLVSPEQE